MENKNILLILHIFSCSILKKGFLILNRAKYLYNLCDNTVKINKILYNIQQKNQHSIIIDSNGSKMDILSFTSKLGKLAITGYLCQSSR